MKKVTVRMVGEAAGVSHSTVSRVLNSDPRVHPVTRDRVLAAAVKWDTSSNAAMAAVRWR